MGFVALKPLTVGYSPRLDDDGNEVQGADGHPVMDPVVRQPGDPIPEADTWPDVGSYISQGHVQWVPDTEFKQIADIDQMKAQLRDQQEQIDALTVMVEELKSVAHTHDKSKTKPTGKEGA